MELVNRFVNFVNIIETVCFMRSNQERLPIYGLKMIRMIKTAGRISLGGNRL